MILVVDISTSRVVFFTTDLTRDLVLASNNVLVNYTGPWPAEITVGNCYNWVLVGDQLVHSATYNNQQGLSVMEINRASYIKEAEEDAQKFRARFPDSDTVNMVLAEKDLEVKPFTSTLAKSIGDTEDNIQAYYEANYAEYKDIVRCSEFIKNRFVRAYELSNSNSELMFLRAEYSGIKTTSKYVDSKERYLIAKIATDVDVSAIAQEINNLPANLWSTNQIDSQQDTQIIQVVKVIQTTGFTYPENTWNSLEYETTEVATQLPALMTWLEAFAQQRKEKLARVMITKLTENSETPWCVDIGKYYQNKRRFHLCISGQYEHTVLNKADIIDPGTLIMVDNKMPHMSLHFGSGDRIAVIFDLEKN